MAPSRKREPAATPAEKPQPDAGYEESHGYGPSHGGPSGPGDAPAQPSGAPAPDDDEET
jgi:hypothetical protein